jgi:hypothetical protein
MTLRFENINEIRMLALNEFTTNRLHFFLFCFFLNRICLIGADMK